jgi:hypothetical protein
MKVAGAVMIALCVIRVISGWLTPRTAAYFIVPPLLICGIVVARQWRILQGGSDVSVRQTLTTSLLCLAGFALPVACFLLLYIHGGLLDWVRGVFIYPARRLELTRGDPPPLLAIAIAAVAWLLIAALVLIRRWWLAVLALGPLVYLALRSYSDSMALKATWFSLAASIPVVALAVFLRLRQRLPAQQDARIFLLAAVAVFCSLVQFPFSAPIYFTYVAPLVILCIVAMFASARALSPLGAAVVLLFYLWVGLAFLRPSSLFSIGYRYAPDEQTAVLALDGARSLRVMPDQAQLYQELVPLIREHARGVYIYVTPSAPELYFLTGHRNPCPWIFDFLDPAAGDVAKVERILVQHHVSVVVIDFLPQFDPPPSPQLADMLRRRFPKSQRIQGIDWEEWWEVRWGE